MRQKRCCVVDVELHVELHGVFGQAAGMAASFRLNQCLGNFVYHETGTHDAMMCSVVCNDAKQSIPGSTCFCLRVAIVGGVTST